MPDDRSYNQSGPDEETQLDPSDSLIGDPGDDLLDRGIIPPDRWSAGMRFGNTDSEAEAGESLDQLLAEEEPDVGVDSDDDPTEDLEGDDDAGDEDVDGLLLDDGPDPRSGRLVAEDEGAHARSEADLVANDAGIDGGAATAEEAAVHVVDDDDNDIRSGD